MKHLRFTEPWGTCAELRLTRMVLSQADTVNFTDFTRHQLFSLLDDKTINDSKVPT